MTDELLAYLLDDLCLERRAEVEGRLASEPELQRELERLRECLASSDDPKMCVDEPPRDLVTRTCCLVERGGAALTPASTMSTCGAAASVGSRWSVTDYTVCAGVVGVLAMLMMPALRESRDAARRQVCSNNLRALGTAVFDYTRVHGRDLPPMNPNEPIGMLASELVEKGGVDPDQLLESMQCPDGQLVDAPLELKRACRVPKGSDWRRNRETAIKNVQLCTQGIAIQAGYTDAQGMYHCARFNAQPRRPFAADAPVFTPYGIVIMVHNGQGVNVLDEGLSVRFVRSPYWADGREHLYFSTDGLPEAGHDSQEVVLIRGDHWPVSPAKRTPLMQD